MRWLIARRKASKAKMPGLSNHTYIPDKRKICMTMTAGETPAGAYQIASVLWQTKTFIWDKFSMCLIGLARDMDESWLPLITSLGCHDA